MKTKKRAFRTTVTERYSNQREALSTSLLSLLLHKLLFLFLWLPALSRHTILKVKFLYNNSILTKLYNFLGKQLKSANPHHFYAFLTQIFFDNFFVKSKLSTAKKSKTTTFSRVFHPKKIVNFLGKSKLNFRTKNEDFEQCVSSKDVE